VLPSPKDLSSTRNSACNTGRSTSVCRLYGLSTTANNSLAAQLRLNYKLCAMALSHSSTMAGTRLPLS
jgi:hypothetical protein